MLYHSEEQMGETAIQPVVTATQQQPATIESLITTLATGATTAYTAYEKANQDAKLARQIAKDNKAAALAAAQQAQLMSIRQNSSSDNTMLYIGGGIAALIGFYFLTKGK